MADLSAQERRVAAQKGQAMPGGRFPILNRGDLEDAIRAVGRAKGDHAVVRRFIAKRARALGLTELIPDTWNADGTLKG